MEGEGANAVSPRPPAVSPRLPQVGRAIAIKTHCKNLLVAFLTGSMMSTPFQSSVLRKQLDSLNGLACKRAYDRLQAYFGDLEMQSRIVTMKEEEFQGPFLERLFGDVLGYTPKWNINVLNVELELY